MSIHPTAIIHADARLGADVDIGPYCIIGANVRIGDRTRLLGHVFLDGHTTIGTDCAIFPFASIGTQTQDLKFKGGQTSVEIGDRTTLREYVTVNSGTNEGDVTHVGSGCHIMASCHVAHQCVVGDGVIMSNLATLAGHVVVEDRAIIGGMTGVHQFVRIGTLSMLGACSKATQDIPPYVIADGNPATLHGPNNVGLQRNNVDAEARTRIKEAYRILCRSGLSTTQALERIQAEIAACPETDRLVAFIKASERGIAK